MTGTLARPERSFVGAGPQTVGRSVGMGLVRLSDLADSPRKPESFDSVGRVGCAGVSNGSKVALLVKSESRRGRGPRFRTRERVKV